MYRSPSVSPSHNPTVGLKTKKLLTYITMGVFFLSGGVEYSKFQLTILTYLLSKTIIFASILLPLGVILPTCLDYMTKRFHSPQWLYGLTLSAMSMTNLFAGPVMGGIYDRTHQTKPLVIVLLLFQIGGWGNITP